MSVTVFFEDGNLPSLTLHKTPAARSKQCMLEYMDEGGANIIFKFRPLDGKPIPGLKWYLLRVRKDLSHVPTTIQQFDSFNTNFRGLFSPGNLIDQELIRIDVGVMDAINTALRGCSSRPLKRQNDVVPRGEPLGLLIEDMTPRDDDGILVKFKAKWLLQSPNAPKGARRCRTCAIRAQRESCNMGTATDAQACCPLDLVSEDIYKRQDGARLLTRDILAEEHIIYQGEGGVLEDLEAHQAELDPKGVLNIDENDEEAVANLCKAMTLRDCTVYVRRMGHSTIDTCLGDLDLKQPTKLAGWKRSEEELIRGGWYTNEEDEEVWIKEEKCSLSRETTGWWDN